MCGRWPRILPVRLICSAQLRSGLTFAQLRSGLTFAQLRSAGHISLCLWGIISQRSTANRLPSHFIFGFILDDFVHLKIILSKKKQQITNNILPVCLQQNKYIPQAMY